jgi:hypothetical protein
MLLTLLKLMLAGLPQQDEQYGPLSSLHPTSVRLPHVPIYTASLVLKSLEQVVMFTFSFLVGVTVYHTP